MVTNMLDFRMSLTVMILVIDIIWHGSYKKKDTCIMGKKEYQKLEIYLLILYTNVGWFMEAS